MQIDTISYLCRPKKSITKTSKRMNASSSLTRKRTWKDWLAATRPWSFPASAIPVIVTLAYLHWQGADIHWGYGIWALLNIVVFHAVGNTWNDVLDYRYGVDTPYTYGSQTITSGLFTVKEIRGLALGLLVVAVAGGLGLTICTGWTLLWIGAAGTVCALLYPYLKYRALGDVAIAVTYAWLPMWGTAFVATGSIHPETWVLAVPVGMITLAILHANNTRDAATDAGSHITTLAMKLGHRHSVRLYLFWVICPFVFLPACVATGLLPAWSLLPMATLPLAVANARMMRKSAAGNTSGIARLDERTAQLQLLFGVLLALSFVVAA